MSFSLVAAGRIDDAVEHVKNTVGYGDTSQLDDVKEFILDELGNWPTGPSAPKGVFVEASGHHDAQNRQVNISIRSLFLPTPPTAEGDEE
jgi:hypothetical protein